MNELIKNLIEQLKGTGGGPKAVAALVGLAVLVVVGAAAVIGNRPDYQLAFSDLSDHDFAAVNKALSEAGIPFDVSQPPAPFSVYVDEDERPSAYMAVYGAGALDKPLKGILSESGVASVFNSAEERQQGVRKREWEEMEKMLEVLDFVLSARVRTSPGTVSPLAGLHAPPTTASVTLRIVNDALLSRDQSETVANLVSRGLGVAKKHLIISDQTGFSLYDGAAELDEGRDVRDLLAHQAAYDSRTTNRANEVLRDILGPDKARVTISSEWDYDQRTTRTETPVGKGALVSETKSTSERPLSETSFEAAGVASNVALSGADPAAGTRPDTPPSDPPVEKTSEERREYRPTITTEEKVRFVPTLKRLSVAFFVDQSIDAAEIADLEEAIKTAVGFDAQRDDFNRVVLPFFTDDASDDTESAATVTPTDESNPLIETLLRRGVEIATALVFVVLLLKSLRTSAKRAPQMAAAAETAAAEEVDPELLARAQVEELLRSDPERVGEILSSWARSERHPTEARS